MLYYYCLLLLLFIIIYCFVLFFYHLFLLFYLIQYIKINIPTYLNQYNQTTNKPNQKYNIINPDILVHHQPPARAQPLTQSYHHTTILSYQHIFITLT